MLTGVGGMLQGKDTVFQERMTIRQDGRDIYYLPMVKDQNDGKPVEFKMTSALGDEFIFENPSHDFPQKITYRHAGDSLLAEISGLQNGKQRAEKFPMSRKK
jgi:hypothetical protein